MRSIWNGKRISKRLARIIDKKEAVIGRLREEAERSEKRVKELHRLRKESRDTGYLLDLMGGKKAQSAKVDLDALREKIGSIRDDDLLLQILSSQPSVAEGKGLLRELTAERRAKYRELVASSQFRSLGESFP